MAAHGLADEVGYVPGETQRKPAPGIIVQGRIGRLFAVSHWAECSRQQRDELCLFTPGEDESRSWILRRLVENVFGREALQLPVGRRQLLEQPEQRLAQQA